MSLKHLPFPPRVVAIMMIMAIASTRRVFLAPTTVSAFSVVQQRFFADHYYFSGIINESHGLVGASAFHKRGYSRIFPPPASEKRRATQRYLHSTRHASGRSTPEVDTSSASTRERIVSKLSRKLRQGIGTSLSVTGFVMSATASILKNPRKVWDQTQAPLEAVRHFLDSSGIQDELVISLKRKSLGINLALLRRIHQAQEQEQSSPSDDATVPSSTAISPTDAATSAVTLSELQRFMRYATAVYGSAMIRAAEVDARGTFREVANGLGQDTLQTISRHIQVPVDDIVLIQIDQDYENENADKGSSSEDDGHETPHVLRHLIAVDHGHRQVILSLRGTFSLQEVVVDIVSFTRESFGRDLGQAHEGMASMAEEVWKVAGPSIVQTLEAHPDYELVIVGHSLGAGTACLLTMLLQDDYSDENSDNSTGLCLPPGTSIRCVAFAAPPVLAPTTSNDHHNKYSQKIVNVIHEHDVVPFLSVYSVRYLIASLEAVRRVAKDVPWRQRLAMLVGSEPPCPSLMKCLPEESSITAKPGAPRLQVPAHQTLYLKQDPHHKDKSYQLLISPSPTTNSSWKIQVHPNMFIDHFPPRYEYALEHVQSTTSSTFDKEKEPATTSSAHT